MWQSYRQHPTAPDHLAGGRQKHDGTYGTPARGMVAVTTTYTVVAKRWRHGWELHIEGLGVTLSRNLAEAEAMARGYIALDLDIPEDSFDVRVMPEVGDGLDELIKRTRGEIADAARAQSRAAESSRALVQKLKLLGLSGKDTALVLGVTPQRVSQLAGARAKKAGAATASRGRDASATGGGARTSGTTAKTSRVTQTRVVKKTAAGRKPTAGRRTTGRNRGDEVHPPAV
jgi:hypothetical protein